MKGDPLETLNKFAKKMSHKAEKPAQKIEPASFCLADLKKAATSMPSASRSSVVQFSVSASQLIKLIKSVSSLVLKKEKKSHCYSLRFLRKAPTKNHVQSKLLKHDTMPDRCEAIDNFL